MDDLTLKEYNTMMKALTLKRVDDLFYIHKTAYETQRAKATKKQGKSFVSVYKNFKDFFDYEKELKEAEKRFKHLETNQPDEPKFKSLIEYKRQQLNK